MSEVMSKLEAGNSAPKFEAIDQDGKRVSEASLLGQKTVIYFFPAAGSPGCTKEAIDFQDNLATFTEAGFRVIGVSPDSPEKLTKFIESHELSFGMLSDKDMEMHKAFGAFGEKSLYGRVYTGGLRSTVVFDEAGVVTQALYNVKATGHASMLLKKLGLAA